jgi:hypothetical protein
MAEEPSFLVSAEVSDSTLVPIYDMASRHFAGFLTTYLGIDSLVSQEDLREAGEEKEGHKFSAPAHGVRRYENAVKLLKFLR